MDPLIHPIKQLGMAGLWDELATMALPLLTLCLVLAVLGAGLLTLGSWLEAMARTKTAGKE